MEKNYTNLLWKYFENIRYWVEYAEKKNAILITMVSVEIALINFLGKSANQKYINFCIIFLLISFFISIISFIPKTSRLNFFISHKKRNYKANLNLIFFEDIKYFDRNQLIHSFQERYKFVIKEDYIAQDICDQIIILSKIASIKFKLFKFAFFAFVFGQAGLGVILVINII